MVGDRAFGIRAKEIAPSFARRDTAPRSARNRTVFFGEVCRRLAAIGPDGWAAGSGLFWAKKRRWRDCRQSFFQVTIGSDQIFAFYGLWW
ncbi:MAG: hypothetical protein ACKOB0_14045, partial [Chthoniobacterales bacterium]